MVKLQMPYSLILIQPFFSLSFGYLSEVDWTPLLPRLALVLQHAV